MGGDHAPRQPLGVLRHETGADPAIAHPLLQTRKQALARCRVGGRSGQRVAEQSQDVGTEANQVILGSPADGAHNDQWDVGMNLALVIIGNKVLYHLSQHLKQKWSSCIVQE